MMFQPLLDLHLIHNYYADRRCPDFWIEPIPATQRLLSNYRRILKTVPNGVRIFTAMADDGTALVPLQTGLTFVFHLRLKNPDFALFTDLKEIAQATAPIYTNVDASVGNPVQLALRSREVESARRVKEVFADIEINYHDSPPESAHTSGAFQVSFKAKAARWKYYVVTDRTAGQFRIEDKGAAPIIFGDNNRTDLNEHPDLSDPIAKALAEQYPKLRRLRFVSDDLVDCQEEARKTIQLYLEGNQVIGALPNPSFRNYVTTQVVGSGNPHKEDGLFQVITYLAQ